MNEQIISINYSGLNLKVSVSTIKKGSKKWIVFLHGIQSNKELFTELMNQPFLQSYSLLAIDFIGFGKSSKPEKFNYDVLDQANVCKKLLIILNIKELHLIGHSLGGMVGTMLLKSLNNIVKSFINMEGNLAYSDCGLSKIVERLSFEDFKSQYAEKISVPDFVFYKTSSSIVNWSKSEKLLKLFNESSVKKLFIYGSQNSNKIKALSKDFKSAIIPNTGHFMLKDNPKECFKVIEKFYSELG